MNQRTFAYVCAPSAENHALRVREHCRTLYELGYLPVAPNMMFAQFLSDSVPEHREQRRGMALSVLRRCRVLVVCSGEITEEMEAQIMLAKRLGIVATTLDGVKKIGGHVQKAAAVN